MAIRNISRETINIVLIAIMALCLIAALVAGAVGIAWTGSPAGATATTIAETSSWLLAAAFCATLVIALVEEHDDRRGEGRARHIS